ncbi:HPr-rel-A system PqqD family peptide chaperone [Roseateles sp. SL47]|uniref:HPr-rel-A system PqqD family peptide chaperone n=1 Tax=Roseateles sp. SL47 TaxID=2995138 RepID=UPI00227070C4|nr:HPr-rel-A system PqqD family peptide chaperone [Roseateles sp. SL47]WAC73847.1 HPr-rel-A system PqqD family peptide chaperone [Roseateles sp. SL47]
MALTATWRCAHRLNEVLRAWEGEQHAVFFNPASGDTHLVAALGAQLAEWLSAAPLTRTQLLHRLTHEVDWDEQPDPDALADLLDLHLRRLVDIELLLEEPAA